VTESGAGASSQRGLRQIWRLLKSDYYAGYAHKHEDERRMLVLMIPRLLSNSCLHANLLVRLMVGSPSWMAYLWRRVLISSHSIDVAREIVIGPGLELPHPIGIVIGTNTTIGANVCIHHGVSAGPTRGRWYPGDPGHLTIGDGVVLFPYCHIQADVGERATIVNHAVVTREIPPDCVAAGAPARVVRRDSGQGLDADSSA
jgi:serine acetyltransferase